MTHLGQAGLLLLLDLVLVKRTPQSAKDHDHDDGHQQLVDGEAVLSGALAHRDWLGYLMEAGLRRRCHCTVSWLPTGELLLAGGVVEPERNDPPRRQSQGLVIPPDTDQTPRRADSACFSADRYALRSQPLRYWR